MPHPEIFEALQPGTELLLDDGKVRLRGRNLRQQFCRYAMPGRRHPVRPQGRQRAECGVAAVGGHRKGSRRSRFRPRARRRLDRLLLCSASRRRRRGPQAGGRARRRHGQARKAVGDPASPRDHRARRRADGRARRSRRRDAAGGRAERAEAGGSRLPGCRKAGCRGDADARIDDHGPRRRPGRKPRMSRPRSTRERMR